MKQGTNTETTIEFEVDLDTVDHIEILCKQYKTTKEFTYPSTTAYRGDGNSVNLVWSASDTYDFEPGKIEIDSRIWLNGTTMNPETEITSIHMDRTLFEE